MAPITETITETVSTVEDQFLELLSKVQEPVVDIVTKAVAQVGERLPEDRPAVPFADSLPNPVELVDAYFAAAEKFGLGFAQRILDNQHSFAKAIAKAVQPLVPQAAKPVSKPRAAKVAAA